MYLRSSLFRDQSVFITWGGPKELRGGGVTRNWVAERGGGYSPEDFVGGGSKIYTVQLDLQYLFLTLTWYYRNVTALLLKYKSNDFSHEFQCNHTSRKS